ncbi:MAG: radical SAM protein [Acidobacteriota bacterium]
MARTARRPARRPGRARSAGRRGGPRAVHDWGPFRAEERSTRPFSPHAPHRVALAYANTYEVGMSSLGFQRVYELIHGVEGQETGWAAERFFTDGAADAMPRGVELDTPLNAFPAVLFSVSFEEDYINLLRMLTRAGIPLRRAERDASHPLVIMGGSCAAINPLPMAAFVDAFCLGAGENVLPELLPALADVRPGVDADRAAALERLASAEGFYVPSRYDPEAADDPLGQGKLRKLELTAEQLRQPGHLPTSCLITPRTEFTEKFLIEMSRGCPEKCKYCWATFGMGVFRWHPTDYILDALDRARAVTDQVGFVATAVGDHPEIARILQASHDGGLRAAVSSIRIPAVKPETLLPLYASGARSITLAPETGRDRMRPRMNQPIPNAMLLEKVRMIFQHGFTSLKLYFIVGLPDETMDDVQAILDLAAECRALGREAAKTTGVMPNVHLGVNILIPKPYTAWQRERMDSEASLKRKMAVLKRGAAQMPNVSLGTMSIRQAVWQTYITRAGQDAAEVIEQVANGLPLARALRQHGDRIRPEVFETFPRTLRWHFMRMG